MTDTERTLVVDLLKAAAKIVEPEVAWLEPPVLMGFTVAELHELRRFVDLYAVAGIGAVVELAKRGLDHVGRAT